MASNRKKARIAEKANRYVKKILGYTVKPCHATATASALIAEKIMADIEIQNHGTVVIIKPLTPRGKEWVEENVQAEGWQKWGGGIASEPRMAQNVIDGAENDGLSISYS